MNWKTAFLAVAAICAMALGHLPAAEPAAPESITSPLGKKMTLRFHDEFEAVPDKDGQPYIDRAKWQTTFWQGSGARTLASNGEAQYYMDKDYAGSKNLPPAQRINPFSFEEPGVLTISASKIPADLWENFWAGPQRHYASGLLISDARYVFKYGYIEGRFKLPAKPGAWPAFWVLMNDPAKGSNVNSQHHWPPEIDIFEAFGHRPQKFSGAMHPIRQEESRPDWRFGYHDVPDGDFSKEFHTWGCEWNETEIVWTFDGAIWARTNTPPSLQVNMYLLINLAVGGNWYSEEMKNAGTPHAPWEVDEDGMPWKMQCDYVRVYQP